MSNYKLSADFDIPKWDVALEALMREEYYQSNRLTLSDIKRLADDYAIRFDDMIVTAFELVLSGEWHYVNRNGDRRDITADEINRLYKGGRIHYKDVTHYDGSWVP
jgi:hypothetical protein